MTVQDYIKSLSDLGFNEAEIKENLTRRTDTYKTYLKFIKNRIKELEELGYSKEDIIKTILESDLITDESKGHGKK
ncbi:MAG: hypothetical protein IJE89_05035 [Bacilli bacterium]|nr:hypothetical protein [Bacilli bacterium]